MNPEDREVFQDRVGAMQQEAKASSPTGSNIQHYASWAGLGVFGMLFMGFLFSGSEPGVPDTPMIPEQAITTEMRPESNAIYGDINPPAPLAPAALPDMALWETQLRGLERSISEQSAAMQAMRGELDESNVEKARYLERLEAALREAGKRRIPERGVSFEDDQWTRAQQLNADLDAEEAARLAAPSMVLDASGEGREDKERREAIERRIGGYPTGAGDVTIVPAGTRSREARRTFTRIE